MSDYGDDYSDDGGEWFYVEDEYMAADDLAEHAVASPPPTTYGDEDGAEEWDRFDYFNDLDYASDGYDNVTFEPQSVKDAKTGQKRKRALSKSHSKKRRATASAAVRAADTSKLEHSPIVWRTQAERGVKPRLLDDNAPSYAVLKNWRDKLGNTPKWARGSPLPEHRQAQPAKPSQSTVTSVPDAQLPQSQMDEDGMEDCEDEEQEEGAGVSQEALMAALQRQLAAAGGPLSGMDPQQLLEFAMRMASGQDDGENIAGEMADAMLGGEEEENDEDAEEKLLSWVTQQRNTNTQSSENGPKSPEITSKSTRLPTPPSSEANRSVSASETTTRSKVPATKDKGSLKRKAEEDDDEDVPKKTTKRRVQKSFDAPTAASQAKAAPVRATRSSARAKRS